jgi:hypothetical protein
MHPLSFLIVLSATSTSAPSQPVECVYAATTASDRQLIGAMAARGGGQHSAPETAAINRLNESSRNCKTANNWPENKARASFEHARALSMLDNAKAALAGRNIPLAPVEKTYGRMTPAMRDALLAGSVDPAFSAILMNELQKAGVKPQQVGRDGARVIGSYISARVAADRTRAAFAGQ